MDNDISQLTNADIGCRIWREDDKTEYVFMGIRDNTYFCFVRVIDRGTSVFSRLLAHDFFHAFTTQRPGPNVDWSVIPPWCRYVAKDGNGTWYAYTNRPELDTDDKAACFISDDARPYHPIQIPPEYSPSYDGDWTLSCVERPV